MWSSDKDSLKATLMLFNMNGIKPNYAALARKYDMDYRTVKKYHEGYIGKPRNRDKPSMLDQYKEIIITKLSLSRTTMKGVYEFLVDEYGIDNVGSYSNFKAYCNKHKLKPKQRVESTPRYETAPGELAEVDWKEDITLTSRSGEIFTINIFHVVLKFSRFSYLELTVSKERSTVLRCLINSFRFFGGVPKKMLFDNMSSIVTTNVKPKRVNEGFKQFAKDFNFEIKLCGFRKPNTKGTNEARNKILDWIRPFNNDFDDFDDLIKKVDKINQKMNIQVCQGTGMPPISLFYKEKEYLSPIACNEIIESYITSPKVQVDSSQLIYYKGSRYSVDKSFIHEYVQPEEFNGKLYIYYNGKCIQVHEISNEPINYSNDHYREAFIKSAHKNEDINDLITHNLKQMDSLLQQRTVSITKEEAVNSIDAMITYLLSHSCGIGNYVNQYIKSLSKDKITAFYYEMKKLLPYVEDEEALMYNFRFIVKNSDIEHIRMNVWLQDYIYDSEILSEEGYRSIYQDYKIEIQKYINEERIAAQEE